MIFHKGGVPWYEAPVPPRWHNCYPHSTEPSGLYGLLTTGRCPCGGYYTYMGYWPLNDYWLGRNTRRKESGGRYADVLGFVGQLIVRPKRGRRNSRGDSNA